MSRICALSVFFIALLVFAPSFVVADNPCAACHDSSYDQHLRVAGDTVPDDLSAGASASATITVENYCTTEQYSTLDSVTVTLSSSYGGLNIEPSSFDIGTLRRGETRELEFTVTSSNGEPDAIVVEMTGYNQHEDLTITDTDIVRVNSPVVLLDKMEFTPSDEPHLIVIKARADLAYLSLTPSLNASRYVTFSPAYITDLKKGQEYQVYVYVDESSPDLKGYVVLEWGYADGSRGAQAEAIEVASKKASQSGFIDYHLWGRIMGFISLALLIASMVMGGPTIKTKVAMSKAMPGLRRIKFHCAVSYMILAVVLLHAILLMARIYHSYAVLLIFSDFSSYTATGITLGDISMVFMLVISLNGIFQRQITALMGAKGWRYIHRYFSWGALILAIIHMLMIGTTFKFLGLGT